MPNTQPSIVVLDGYTLNPGDNPWTELEALGSVKVYDRTTDPKDIVSRSKGAQVLITNKTPITKEIIDSLPEVKYIGVIATGYNVVDYKYAREKGIPVTNIPVYGTDAVAQFVFALLLELCHHAGHHSEAVRQGRWSGQPDFCFWDFPLVELAGRTLGIVGFGKIGRRVAEIGVALGMKILAHDTFKENPPSFAFEWAEVDDLLKKSDVVSLNCPLFPENTGMINKNSLKLMKKSAFLINASRGGLVVDQDLADALNTGLIAGAGLDVVGFAEPPAKDNPLLKAKNCIVTPHIAWAAFDARKRLMHTAAENVKAFLNKKPLNVVN
jgi:glycerate dehydrogenase